MKTKAYHLSARKPLCGALMFVLWLGLSSRALAQPGWVLSHQKISDTEGGFTGTLDDFDYFGYAVASLGDLDGDGVGDLAVGAIGDDDGGTNRGAVWVLFLDGVPVPACPWDLSGDGDVGPFDLALLLGVWGPCPQPCEPGDPAATCAEDLDGNCNVGPFDLALLLGNWGPCP